MDSTGGVTHPIPTGDTNPNLREPSLGGMEKSSQADKLYAGQNLACSLTSLRAEGGFFPVTPDPHPSTCSPLLTSGTKGRPSFSEPKGLNSPGYLPSTGL